MARSISHGSGRPGETHLLVRTSSSTARLDWSGGMNRLACRRRACAALVVEAPGTRLQAQADDAVFLFSLPEIDGKLRERDGAAASLPMLAFCCRTFAASALCTVRDGDVW